MNRLLSLLTFLTLAGSAFSQNTWYVDSHAVPPGNGTLASPYANIHGGIASPTTHTGDTLLVAAGTYVENVTIQSKGVYVRSLAGPAATTIQGFVLLDGIEGGSGPALLEGFTLLSAENVAMGGATLRRCIVRNPGPPVSGSRGIFFEDYSVIENCVVTGYERAFQMFFFASFPAQIQNTIAFGNNTTISSSDNANFLDCCLPSIPGGRGISATGTVLGSPGFWDAAHADLHLAPGSHCIDAGFGTDPDGSVADIGALPFDASYATGPANYCSTNLTSDGCLASMSASGTCSLTSASPFLLTASNVSTNKLGRLLYSFGEANTPFQGGTLCLALPLTRTPPSYSGSNGLPPPQDACSGVFSFDFNARVQSGVDPLLVPGKIVYAQYRFRDPFAPGGFGVAWSDALRFGIAP